MRWIVFPLAAAAVAAAAACLAPASGQVDEAAAPIYGVKIPAGYRDWQLISVNHLAGGSLKQVRAQLGNDIAAKAFRDGIRRFARANPTPKWIVVAAEPMTDIDTTASDVLEDLDEDLNQEGISLVFAELKDPVKDKLKRFGLFTQFGEGAFYPTLDAAVGRYLESHDVHWEDREDRHP